MSPRVLVVQHEDDDPIHRMGEWMGDVDLVVRRAHLGDDVPASLEGHDALVVMGGAMGWSIQPWRKRGRRAAR